MKLLLDQKVIERDWSARMFANIYAAIDRLEEYIGSGNAKYLLLAILVLVLVVLSRRRR